MGSSLDGSNNAPGLGQRRQAASNLPTFELPPPPNIQLAAQHLGHTKFPPLSIGHHVQPAQSVSVGNLLTPPSNSASESGASSSNLPSGTTPNGPHGPVLPYTPGFWGPGSTPTSFGTGLTPQPWQHNPLYGRSMFSPGLRNNSNSPAAGEHSSLPPPPFELSHHHSFPSMGMPSPAVGNNSSQQQVMSNMMSNMPRPQSQASPISPADGVSKPSPIPGLYTSMSASNTPQPPQYGFQSNTPVSQSPHPNHVAASRISPPLQPGPMPQLHQPKHFIQPPYPSYSVPGMPGPVMTNIPMPGSQLSAIGNVQANMLPIGFHSGYSANPPLYPPRANSPQQPTNDRPFKCDQCPQSFNRNHDLKRHKRIHLAVKPFPCKHCDKSFSRKDALKVCFAYLSISDPKY